MSRGLLLLPLASLLACTHPPEPESPAPADPEANFEHCAPLEEAACRADALCRPIEGQRVNAEAECLEARSFAGCAPEGLVCTAAETAARRDEGACWLFNSGCLPAGPWTPDKSCQDPAFRRPACDPSSSPEG